MAQLLPELIEGPRFTLRRWEAGDANAMARAVERNIDHLRPFMPWIADEPLAPARRLALLISWEQAWSLGGDVILGAFGVDDDDVVGSCGLHRRRGPHALELGYWVDKDHLGQGIGTEMARLLTTAAFGVPGVTATEIHHDKANVASGRIAQRLGYSFIGETPRSVTGAVAAPGEIGVDWGWRMVNSGAAGFSS